MKIQKGCLFVCTLGALLLASVFGISAYTAGSISSGGAVTLIVGVFLSLTMLTVVLMGGKAG